MVHLIVFAKRVKTDAGHLCPYCFRKLKVRHEEVKLLVERFDSYKEARDRLEELRRELESQDYEYEWWMFSSNFRYGYGSKIPSRAPLFPLKIERGEQR